MTAIQNKIVIENFYIHNGNYKAKNFKTAKELKENLNFITPHGYNSIGVIYHIPNVTEGSVDIWNRDENEDFSLSNDVYKSKTFDPNLLDSHEELKAVKEVILSI